MVPAQPPKTHLRSHVMQKEPIILLNFPRRDTISGVQNLTLQTKIDTEIRLFRRVYKWSLAQRLSKTLDPLLLYTIVPEISTPEKSAFAIETVRTCQQRHYRALYDFYVARTRFQRTWQCSIKISARSLNIYRISLDLIYISLIFQIFS